MKEFVSVDDAIQALNEALEVDRNAVESIILNRVPCNKAVVEHPVLMAGAKNDGSDPKLGALGLINALFGYKQGGPICFVFIGQNLRFQRFDDTLLLATTDSDTKPN